MSFYGDTFVLTQLFELKANNGVISFSTFSLNLIFEIINE